MLDSTFKARLSGLSRGSLCIKPRDVSVNQHLTGFSILSIIQPLGIPITLFHNVLILGNKEKVKCSSGNDTYRACEKVEAIGRYGGLIILNLKGHHHKRSIKQPPASSQQLDQPRLVETYFYDHRCPRTAAVREIGRAHV